MKRARPKALAARRRKYRHLIYGDYVSELVERACRRLELDQKALGEAIGIDHTKLSEYRNGRSHASEAFRRILVDQLGADPDELAAREFADKVIYLQETMEVTPKQRARAWRLLRGKD